MKFTDYVAQLSPKGYLPGESSFNEVLDKLRRILFSYMKKRRLLSAPPYFLGVDAESWNAEAWRELALDCYFYNFTGYRLKKLRNIVLAGDEIEGLVPRNVVYFLSDRQRGADPIGDLVYKRLDRAIDKAIESGELHKDNGGSESDSLNNGTVLFFPQCDSSELWTDFDEIARAWSDDLLPELVTAQSNAVTKVVDRLRGHMIDLRDRGVEAFVFKDLIDAMKKDVRTRWACLYDSSRGPLALDFNGEHKTPVPVVRQPNSLEFRQMLDSVEAGIEREPRPKRRERLREVWGFIYRHFSQMEKRPKWTWLSKKLEIPSEAVKKLFSRLEDLIKAYQFGTDSEKTKSSREEHEISTPDEDEPWRNAS